MNTLIFVVIAVIMATAGVHTEKVAHLVLVKRKRAGIVVGIFVILIKFTALTARLKLVTVL